MLGFAIGVTQKKWLGAISVAATSTPWLCIYTSVLIFETVEFMM